MSLQRDEPSATEPHDSTPIVYRVDRERGLIFEQWRGTVTARDLEHYWKHMLADPEALAVRRTLVDLRDATLVFHGDDLMNLIATHVLPVLKGRTWHTAIVVANPVQFGVSRQYSAFADHFSDDAIFDNEWDALRWLEARPQH